MNWKNSLQNKYIASREISYPEVETFIKTEIIEKLINDIPKGLYYFDGSPDADGTDLTAASEDLKQQLKDKWL